MKTSVAIDLSPQIRISYLAKFWFSSYGPKCSWPIKLQDSLKCNISRKKWKNEVYFWHVEEHLNFLQVDFIILCVSSQAYPKYPKYEVCISLQYLQKNIGFDFFFCFCLQINTKVFYKVVVLPWMCVSRLAQSTQNNKFPISLKIGRMKLFFCLQKNIKYFFKLILSF